MINILLANDHNLFRFALIKLLHETQHIRIIEEAVSFPDIYSQLLKCKPDILLSDDQMPGGYLINDLPKIKELYPNLKIIANSYNTNISYLKELIKYTEGLVSLASDVDEYIKAIETVHNGGLHFILALKKHE